MRQIMNGKGRPLFRMIIPAFPEINVFSRFAKRTTALGAVMVATAANKLWDWDVEIIDENNYHGGPRGKNGLPDHNVLQRERPAAAVGFYCGLSSTMFRVWELIKFYKMKNVAVIAGGWHVRYLPEETLGQGADIVVKGDGEKVIRLILRTLFRGDSWDSIPGISFRKEGTIISSSEILEIEDLNDLPFPDFGLLRFAKIKRYPISRIRGCGMSCEFCSVKGNPRWSSPQRLFETVDWLVETRGARKFFLNDDRSEEDPEGTLEFFRLISEKYKDKIDFTVQIRLAAAENKEFLEIMKKAGVRMVCVGYESPIKEDLRAMRKGLSSAKMLEWTEILSRYFWIHAMFIAGYPLKESGVSFGAKEIVKQFKSFIGAARLSSIQIMLPGPIAGTELRERLRREGKLFPLAVVPWSKYDGNYICFQPDNMTAEELQNIPSQIMRWFYYNPFGFLRIGLRILVFPIDYLIRGWRTWRKGWKKDILRYGAYLLIQKWAKKQKKNDFLKRVKEYQLKHFQ